MAFQYLTNTPLAQAQQEYLAKLISQGMEPPVEQVPIAAACGRITAEAIYAHICAPHYHASAMDGICISATATSTTCIRFLAINTLSLCILLYIEFSRKITAMTTSSSAPLMQG